MKNDNYIDSKKVANRINKNTKVLIFLIFASFSIILFKLFIITYLQAASYEVLMENSSDIYVYEETPRGEIYDRNGLMLAGNTQSTDLVYIETGKMSFENKLEAINKVDELVGLDEHDWSKSDYQNLWINTFVEDAEVLQNEYFDSLTEEEYTVATLDDANIYVAENISSDYMDQLVEYYGSKTIVDNYILTQSSTGNNSVVLKENLTTDEIYAINENMGTIGGFYTADNWTRLETKYYDEFGTMLGNTGKIEEDDWEYYNQIGYSISEEVGISGIEEAYEPVLHGQQNVYQLIFDEDGNIIDKILVEESSGGNDIVLTIDINLQAEANDEIIKYLNASKYYDLTDQAYAIISDPYTGDLYAIAGQRRINNEYYEYSMGNYTSAFEVGSSVKPITLLKGYTDDVWERGQTVYDAPMKFSGSEEISSWTNFGSINETTAITRSSNIYFMNVALALAGESYIYNGPLNIENSDYENMRKFFSEFGLGTETGIDMSYENTGYKGIPDNPAKYLFLAIGQFDTYTNLQLNQYISTYGNGGDRMKVNYIYSINESGGVNELGSAEYYQSPEISNIVSADQDDLNYVRSLLLGPSQNPQGTASNFNGSYYDLAGKTGTAETFYQGSNESYYGTATNNSSFIGFAPYDEPEMSISVLVPSYHPTGLSTPRSGATLGESIADIYFESYSTNENTN